MPTIGGLPRHRHRPLTRRDVGSFLRGQVRRTGSFKRRSDIDVLAFELHVSHLLLAGVQRADMATRLAPMGGKPART